MNKKILSLISIGILSISLVACSSDDSEKVETGNATQVEQSNGEQASDIESEATEVVLVDDDTIKATVTEKTVDVFGAGYNVTIENKTDKKIIVQTRETSIDGVMEDPIFSEEITAGKTSKGMIQFMNITELDDLKNLEGKLVVLDEDYMDLKVYDMIIE